MAANRQVDFSYTQQPSEMWPMPVPDRQLRLQLQYFTHILAYATKLHSKQNIGFRLIPGHFICDTV